MWNEFVAKEKVPVFSGRWQPFHNGHLYDLEKILGQYGFATLGVVNADPDNPLDPDFDKFLSSENPLYYWERVYMITKFLRARKWDSRVALVPMWHPRKSMEKDNNYLPPLRRRFWFVPIISEEEIKKAEDFKKLGEDVVKDYSVPEDVLKYRATVVRRRMSEGQDWRKMVPDEIAHCLDEMDTSKDRWRGPKGKKLPIFGGRWQPFHSGHLHVLREAIKQHGEVVIGIVNPEPPNANWESYPSFHPVHNPFTYWERLTMLMETLQEENLLNNCYFVPLRHPRADVLQDKSYLPPERFWLVPTTSSHELGKVAELVAQGEEVTTIDVPEDIISISSSKVKSAIYNNEDWAQLVPNAVHKHIIGIHGEERIKNLIDSHKTVFEEYLRTQPKRSKQPKSSVLLRLKDGTPQTDKP